VRFVDFLKATVMLSGGAATLLAALTVVSLSQEYDGTLVVFSALWWAGAVLIGLWLGRRAETSPPIRRLLLNARTQTTLPEMRPAWTLINRVWPLLFATIGASILSVYEPQVAAVASGFCIIWALAWRRQAGAVAAIEERDAVRFYIDRTSPMQPMRLVRTPGFGGAFLRHP
jgi:hypothetical protein